MKRDFAIFLLLLFLVGGLYSIDNLSLEKVKTNKKIDFLKHKPKYLKGDNLLRGEHSNTIHKRSLKFSPPTVSVRAMAEWEPCDGVALAWIPEVDYEIFDTMNIEILRHLDTANTVYIVVPRTTDRTIVRTMLTNAGIYTGNIQFMNIANIEMPWIRDFGGLNIYHPTGELAFIDPLYGDDMDPYADTFPTRFSSTYGLSCYVFDPCEEGGNYMTDGHGLLIQTDYFHWVNTEYYDWGLDADELDSLLKVYLNVNRVVTLPVNDYIEGFWHVDIIAKLIDEHTIILAQYPDTEELEYEVLENCYDILDTLHTYDGGHFDIIRIPITYNISGYDTGYQTYLNSLILNDQVIVPIYDSPYDSVALRIYREAMPDYEIIPIKNLVWGLWGGPHCLTKEIPLMQELSIVDNEKASQPESFMLNAYPNPFNSSVKIQINGNCEDFPTVQIYNIQGQCIFKNNVKLNRNTFLWFPDENIGSGIYFVSISNLHNTATQKIIYLK